MGVYTGLRVKVTVKEEFRQMIKEINEGADWGEFVEQFPFLSDYAEQERAKFIPSGASRYMPDSWETDGLERNINIETGYWTFQCSLKNYNQEIQQFFKEVLPKIIDSADHIEYLNEEWDKSIMYTFKWWNYSSCVAKEESYWDGIQYDVEHEVIKIKSVVSKWNEMPISPMELQEYTSVTNNSIKWCQKCTDEFDSIDFGTDVLEMAISETISILNSK